MHVTHKKRLKTTNILSLLTFFLGAAFFFGAAFFLAAVLADALSL